MNTVHLLNHAARTLRRAFPLLAAAATLATVQPAHSSEWSDTFLGYRYGTAYREPVNTKDISKSILQFQHVSGYKYGSNFFNVDMLISDKNDPANGGGGGAQEVYVVYRSTLSLSKTTGKKIEFGPVADLGITAGFDFNAKNDAFSPRVLEYYFGPTLNLKVPGFAFVSLLYRTEKNHNAFVGKAVTFDDVLCINSAWGIPIKGTPLVFKGFFNYIPAKGKDGFGSETKAEILTEPALMCDVGSFAGKKGTLYMGVSYQYWKNKFGSDSAKDPTGGSTAKTAQFQVEIHF